MISIFSFVEMQKLVPWTGNYKRKNYFMWQSYFSIWLHFVWSTKNRELLIPDSKCRQVYKVIRQVAEEKKIWLDFINGMPDHVHALISATTVQSSSWIAKQLKGCSYDLINDAKILPYHVHRQEGYAVFSVSPQNIKKVRQYIKNQKQHHRNHDFNSELKWLMESSKEK